MCKYYSNSLEEMTCIWVKKFFFAVMRIHEISWPELWSPCLLSGLSGVAADITRLSS